VSDEPRDHTASSDPGRSGSTPVHRHQTAEHRLLIAGRIAVALVAVLVLTATGWEWAIKSRADSGIVSRQISAIVTDDSNLSTATVAPPAPGSYAPENILLLGSDTRSGANGNAGNTDASTGDGVANSDTQMIAHISGDRQHVTVLSIPRPDLRQGLPGQQRRSLAHQLGVLGGRPEMLGARYSGPHRAQDRPGDRH
jgi:hypothetical protein